jgi:hypothetical protein
VVREGGGGTSDGGEELGLGEAEADAMGIAKAVKFGAVEREVDAAEGATGVIYVGQVSGGREGVRAGGGTEARERLRSVRISWRTRQARRRNPSSWRKEDQVAVLVWN